MKLTVIIVNYNVKYYLEACINSLRKALEGIEAQIYVVDNHSTDGSVAYLASLFTDIHIVENTENLGFSRANNIAINTSDSEYVLLLNPDTVVAEDTIRDTISFMDKHRNAGALGVKMLNTDGSVAKESRRGIPSPITAFYKMCGLCDRFPNHHKIAHYYMSYLPWDKPSQIEIVSGAFCLLRRKTLNEVGLLDEDFFMYGEDIDLSYRIFNKGWEVWYHPSEILHYKGESTQKTSYKYVHVFYQAMLIFFQKHYSHLSFLLSLPIRSAIYIKALSTLANIQLEKLSTYLNGKKSNEKSAPLYQFVVSPQNKALCSSIISKNALSARFTEIENIDYDNTDTTGYVIFDVELISYKQIFKIFSATAHPKLKMGFLNPTAHIIITENNIYKDE